MRTQFILLAIISIFGQSVIMNLKAEPPGILRIDFYEITHHPSFQIPLVFFFKVGDVNFEIKMKHNKNKPIKLWVGKHTFDIIHKKDDIYHCKASVNLDDLMMIEFEHHPKLALGKFQNLLTNITTSHEKQVNYLQTVVNGCSISCTVMSTKNVVDWCRENNQNKSGVYYINQASRILQSIQQPKTNNDLLQQIDMIEILNKYTLTPNRKAKFEIKQLGKRQPSKILAGGCELEFQKGLGGRVYRVSVAIDQKDNIGIILGQEKIQLGTLQELIRFTEQAIKQGKTHTKIKDVSDISLTCILENLAIRPLYQWLKQESIANVYTINLQRK